MKLLIIGSSPQTADFGKTLTSDCVTVTQCTNVRQALDALKTSPYKYDWVLVEERGACLDQKSAQQIGQLAPDAPVSFVHHFDPDRLADPSRPAVCAVERTPEGLQILHCALQTARREQSFAPVRSANVTERSWQFEYHAPCHVADRD
ncbi:MAG: hypothetical protein ACREX4_13950 [Gammaproteobacteria bacterium]